jgi:hypothetical protein
LPGMFKGKKIKPEDIVDEVKKRWFFKKKVLLWMK